MSQILEFYAGDAGTIVRWYKAGGVGAVRGAATGSVMAGFYNISPTDLDILTARACHLLGERPLDFMGSLAGITGGGPGIDCSSVSPAWVGLMASLPDQSIDLLAGLWVAGLAEEHQGAAPDEGELRRGLHDLIGVCRHARGAEGDVVFVWV